jgi:hypothetical protein
MTWFKVDDKFHSHNKVRKVLAEEPIALALWVVAGSWSSDNLTDGFVPDHQLPWLIPVGAELLAQRLVTAGLWKRVRAGYQFHEWATNGDGTKRNPTKKEVEEERRKKAEAGRMGGVASGKVRSTRQARASAPAKAHSEAPASLLVEPPTRPGTSNEVPRSSPSDSRAPDPEGFEEFWRMYPPRRNSSKADARKAYVRALKAGADPADILTGAKAYAEDRRDQDQQFTAHAATWLNGKRWEVLLTTPVGEPSSAAWWNN